MTQKENQASDGLHIVILILVRKFLEGESFEAMHGWFVESARALAPDWLDQFGHDEGLVRAIGLQMVRFIWTRTPDPKLGFDTRKLDKPQRNRPCPCGSGRKYKHCCQQLPDLVQALSRFSLLPYVLDHLPRKELKNLPFDRLNPLELAHVAQTWTEQDRARDAMFLLESFFQNVKRLDHRAEWAFDQLMDLYLAFHHPRKRKCLLEQALNAGDKQLRAAALQRQSTMLADEGKTDAAWALFTEAQRLDPDNPSLAHLEITLLVAQGRLEEATERARFWAARIRRAGEAEYEDLIGWLEEFAEDPRTATMMVSPDGEPVKRLLELLEQQPEPTSHYRLQPHEGDAGPLQPSPEIATLESEWMQLLGEPWDENDLDELVSWIEKHPLTLNSFTVLRDLAMAIDESGLMDTIADQALRPLLERGETLLRRVIEDSDARDCRLEWGWLENRPALWLVGELATRLKEENPQRSAALMEWLVLTLNPNDNQGLRGALAHLYIQLGAPEKAIDLSNRYPDDFADMRYARALALHAAGDTGKALSALTDAHQHFPKVLRTLVAKKPRPVPPTGYGITVGGDDEAWLYRLEYRPLWLQTGALDWAASVARTLKR